MDERVKSAIKPIIEKWAGPISPMGLDEIARAALVALREPTEAMEQAGETALHTGWGVAGDAWSAMIDAALNPPPREA